MILEMLSIHLINQFYMLLIIALNTVQVRLFINVDACRPIYLLPALVRFIMRETFNQEFTEIGIGS